MTVKRKIEKLEQLLEPGGHASDPVSDLRRLWRSATGEDPPEALVGLVRIPERPGTTLQGHTDRELDAAGVSHLEVLTALAELMEAQCAARRRKFPDVDSEANPPPEGEGQ